jgi:protocatechuate 3,4-dioxygenase beta subunit
VLPGTYTVRAGCRGYQSRDKYESITITDKDVTGLVWEVDGGATVRGRVLSKTGEPVESVEIWATTVGGAAREREGWSGDSSARDGTYELAGLRPGTYKLETRSERGLGPKDGYRVEVAEGATVQKDLVLDDGGTIKGTVVDSDGAPVAGVSINTEATAAMMWSWGGGDHKSDDAGAFQIDTLRPGEYRVSARRSWNHELRKPGTTDDAKQGEKTVVRANQTSVVKLVVESQKGVIKGTVVDTEGKPVADAFVSAARESDAAGSLRTSVQATRWSWDEKPVLTSVEGTFTVTKLSPGSYTVRAYRKGGGEAVAEHVAVGSTTTLQIKATGSITGAARSPDHAPDELNVTLSDPLTGFSRRETFFKTNGQFVIRDLPKGHFRITAAGDSSQKQIELDLAEGEAKTGVVIELDALVTLTGRLVELGTQTPVPGMQMMATLATGGRFMFSSDSDEREHITDDAGRFKIKNAPRGKLVIRGWPKNFDDDDNAYGSVSTIRTIEGTGTIDIGDIGVLKKRVKKGDPVGELGVNFAEQPRDTLPDKREMKVSWIDPAGPAAKTDLKVGDIVTTIDGIDVTGGNSSNGWTLMRAPPGTKLVLGLARNAKVEITLAAP